MTKSETGRGQVIVVTEADRTTRLVSAVDAFSRRYGLPTVCTRTVDTGCFKLKMVSPEGPPAPMDPTDEVELNVEWVHALAPMAQVVVLTAGDSLLQEVRAVGQFARSGDAHVFSTSWCSPCDDWTKGELRMDAAWARSCNRAHTVCLQGSGDGGAPGDGPANSPYLLAVGGSLFTRTRTGALRNQVAWTQSGGGTTDAPLPLPSWQRNVACGMPTCKFRLIPDVSGPAGSAPVAFWRHGALLEDDGVHGTSLATPLWAALIALANQKLAQRGQPPIGINELHVVLYSGDLRSGLDDITNGARARPGWDSATGWGSPKGGIVDILVRATVRYRKQH